MLLGIGGLSLAAWLYLAFFHGRFWRADQRLDAAGAGDGVPESGAVSTAWPAVVAVVPARDEAAFIEHSLASLLDQDYPGSFAVVMVDDQSDDDTAERARTLAARHDRGDRLEVIAAAERSPGWVGKMWAVHSGVAAALDRTPLPEFVLLTDADVAHDPGNLRRLVAKAGAAGAADSTGGSGPLDLVSLMVRLHCRSAWEKLLIPAFVYFFQKLYPFPVINDPSSRIAGAAGGCMLVRTAALVRVGGIAAIRDRVIDDCALAAAIKSRAGPIWVGVTESEVSVRPYRGLHDIWHMVARSAYTQLHHSPLLLAGTVFGLLLIYVAPPALVLSADAVAASLGLAAWLLMAWTFLPTLRMYGLAPLRALLLPLAGVLYLAMTIDSARLHWLGRGATWKGRAGAGAGAGAG